MDCCLMRWHQSVFSPGKHLATGIHKQWNTLWSMGVFTQLAFNTKGFARKFACKSAQASCVNIFDFHHLFYHQQITVEDVWVRGFPKLITESAFRMLDLNQDGVLDVVYGFGTGRLSSVVFAPRNQARILDYGSAQQSKASPNLWRP